MVGITENVTVAPAHCGFVPAVCEIVAEAVTFEFTVIDIEFDVAGLPVTQAALDVITQLTTCPLVNVDVVNVALLVPTLVPFTFH